MRNKECYRFKLGFRLFAGWDTLTCTCLGHLSFGSKLRIFTWNSVQATMFYVRLQVKSAVSLQRHTWCHFLAAVVPLFFSMQCVSWSILLLVSILTMGGWIAAIFHYKSLIFSDQETPWIDTKLTHTRLTHSCCIIMHPLYFYRRVWFITRGNV